MGDVVYIFDAGPFVIMREYYGGVFSGFWRQFDSAVASGLVVSLSEVRAELEQYGGEQTHLLQWMKEHKGIFPDPSEGELNVLRKILERESVQKLAKRKDLLNKTYFADQLVIAKASYINGLTLNSQTAVVVTRETRKPSQKKYTMIPDVCDEFGIKAINLKEFLQRMRWKFN